MNDSTGETTGEYSGGQGCDRSGAIVVEERSSFYSPV